MTSDQLLNTFAVLLVAHFIADFKFQSHYIAVNKSKSWTVLSAHVFIYTTTVSVYLWAWMALREINVQHRFSYLIWFAAITFTLHFLIDAVSSRVNSAYWKKQQWHAFFVSLGFDQLLHHLSLFATLKVLSRYY